MKARNIDKYTELGKLLIESNRRDDLSITEITKLLQIADADDSDGTLNAIAAAFYIGYAAGYTRRGNSRVTTANT